MCEDTYSLCDIHLHIFTHHLMQCQMRAGPAVPARPAVPASEHGSHNPRRIVPFCGLPYSPRPQCPLWSPRKSTTRSLQWPLLKSSVHTAQTTPSMHTLTSPTTLHSPTPQDHCTPSCSTRHRGLTATVTCPTLILQTWCRAVTG